MLNDEYTHRFRLRKSQAVLFNFTFVSFFQSDSFLFVSVNSINPIYRLTHDFKLRVSLMTNYEEIKRPYIIQGSKIHDNESSKQSTKIFVFVSETFLCVIVLNRYYLQIFCTKKNGSGQTGKYNFDHSHVPPKIDNKRPASTIKTYYKPHRLEADAQTIMKIDAENFELIKKLNAIHRTTVSYRKAPKELVTPWQKLKSFFYNGFLWYQYIFVTIL